MQRNPHAGASSSTSFGRHTNTSTSRDAEALIRAITSRDLLQHLQPQQQQPDAADDVPDASCSTGLHGSGGGADGFPAEGYGTASAPPLAQDLASLLSALDGLPGIEDGSTRSMVSEPFASLPDGRVLLGPGGIRASVGEPGDPLTRPGSQSLPQHFPIPEALKGLFTVIAPASPLTLQKGEHSGGSALPYGPRRPLPPAPQPGAHLQSAAGPAVVAVMGTATSCAASAAGTPVAEARRAPENGIGDTARSPLGSLPNQHQLQQQDQQRRDERPAVGPTLRPTSITVALDPTASAALLYAAAGVALPPMLPPPAAGLRLDPSLEWALGLLSTRVTSRHPRHGEVISRQVGPKWRQELGPRDQAQLVATLRMCFRAALRSPDAVSASAAAGLMEVMCRLQEGVGATTITLIAIITIVISISIIKTTTVVVVISSSSSSTIIAAAVAIITANGRSSNINDIAIYRSDNKAFKADRSICGDGRRRGPGGVLRRRAVGRIRHRDSGGGGVDGGGRLLMRMGFRWRRAQLRWACVAMSTLARLRISRFSLPRRALTKLLWAALFAAAYWTPGIAAALPVWAARLECPPPAAFLRHYSRHTLVRALFRRLRQLRWQQLCRLPLLLHSVGQPSEVADVEAARARWQQVFVHQIRRLLPSCDVVDIMLLLRGLAAGSSASAISEDQAECMASGGPRSTGTRMVPQPYTYEWMGAQLADDALRRYTPAQLTTAVGASLLPPGSQQNGRSGAASPPALLPPRTTATGHGRSSPPARSAPPQSASSSTAAAAAAAVPASSHYTPISPEEDLHRRRLADLALERDFLLQQLDEHVALCLSYSSGGGGRPGHGRGQASHQDRRAQSPRGRVALGLLVKILTAYSRLQRPPAPRLQGALEAALLERTQCLGTQGWQAVRSAYQQLRLQPGPELSVALIMFG
ncbi:hypothetical protein VOLCADRAFT_97077 [Volvox carteri f. nagariensis]|uniref:Uncharacterized protein n=1 Tax=Volvox carteri f. nagariensis TaxID=3068 RepID=D8UBU3_VOLCA|nr:uncharacterized protein VOLCADRAFT_97077 [Volvox carteri f. nagariensis]EFJ42826.1 hypothetical protein VOLCADRAFT_97077 [Volvox carteri f. nagariensis]|eukprot:XP_002956086.1 hypothetical protein VOLCADRAFT_97077 [Volvox carteri f. nagariensis]